MSQIANEVASLLRASNQDLAGAEANTGQGVQGEWPPDGECDNMVLQLHEKVGTFYDGAGKDAAKIPCAELVFEYQLLPDPKSPTYDPSKPALVWRGERFQLVPNYQSTLKNESSVTRARISWERIKGHLSKMLACSPDEVTDTFAAVNRLKAKIQGNVRLAVRVKIDSREAASTKPGGRPRTYRTEYVLESIAS